MLTRYLRGHGRRLGRRRKRQWPHVPPLTVRRVAVVALVTVTALGGGCGGASAGARGENVGVFMTRILREEIGGQWARQWGELHPGHQRLITRLQYVACSRALETNIATGREVFKVLDVRDQPIDVRGVSQRTSKLVTISFHAGGGANALTYQLHAVALQGRWAWILGQRFLSAIAHGRCLDGSPLAATK
jgi:hypothetical protein